MGWREMDSTGWGWDRLWGLVNTIMNVEFPQIWTIYFMIGITVKKIVTKPWAVTMASS